MPREAWAANVCRLHTPGGALAPGWKTVERRSRAISAEIEPSAALDDSFASLDGSPYGLSPTVRDLVCLLAHRHLHPPLGGGGRADDVGLQERWLLLAGPPDTEVLQERVARSIAKEMGASFLSLRLGSFRAAYWDTLVGKKAHSNLKRLGRALDGVILELIALSGSGPADGQRMKEKLYEDLEGVYAAACEAQGLPTTLGRELSKAIRGGSRQPLELLAVKRALEHVEGPIVVLVHGAGAQVDTFRELQCALPRKRLLGVATSASTAWDDALAKHAGTQVCLQVPSDPAALARWTDQLAVDRKEHLLRENMHAIQHALQRLLNPCQTVRLPHVRELADLPSDRALGPAELKRVASWALASAHMRHVQSPQGGSGHEATAVIDGTSVSSALRMLHRVRAEGVLVGIPPIGEAPGGGTASDGGHKGNIRAQKPHEAARAFAEAVHGAHHRSQGVATDEHEAAVERLVVSPDAIGVRFDDVGALATVKRALREMVTLPLRYPQLFAAGAARHASEGLLLSGPPGSGKTMLAKAVATEAGARFLNITMSEITSKWCFPFPTTPGGTGGQAFTL